MSYSKNLIFGSNIKGRGALIWSKIILKKILNENNSGKFYLFVSKELKNDLKFSKKNKIVYINFIYFFLLSLKNLFSFKNKINFFSLGDYPLPLFKQQIIYVNQANLIKNNVYKYTSKKLSFFIKRIYFKIFSRNVKKFIVQSNFMKFKISKSYNLDKKKFEIYRNYTKNPNFKFKLYKNRKKIRLLYPANHYEHKNHQLLIDLFENYKINNIEIYLTATKKEFKKFKSYKNFKRLDYFTNNNLFKIYSKFDAIIFPSLIESLGLPILEAKLFKMPIICSNLEYARELLGKKAFFFNPLSEKSLYRSLMSYFEFKNKKKLNNRIF